MDSSSSLFPTLLLILSFFHSTFHVGNSSTLFSQSLAWLLLELASSSSSSSSSSSKAQGKMLKKILPKSKKKAASPAKAVSSLDQIHETLETWEKKEQLLQKKISAEIEKAKDYMKLKNKKAAIRCLTKKKQYEAQIEQLGKLQLQVHAQLITLQGATATTETIDALRKGSDAVRSIQRSLSIDDVSRTLEEASEQAENMKQMQDALANSIGVVDDFDEDELEAELEELEEAELEEEQIVKLNSTVVPPEPSNIHKRETPRHVNSADELADLQAEMAL